MKQAKPKSEREDRRETAVNRLLDAMAQMLPDERLPALDRIKAEYCEHCGCVQSSPVPCQCWNDE